MGQELLVILCLATVALASNATDCAFVVPGFTSHGDCNLLCRPAEWRDVIIFYVGNYAAHVATVNSRPGQSFWDMINISFVVLLMPGAGLTTAFDAIQSRAVFAPTQLQRAARAGALYAVMKDPSKEPETVTENAESEERKEPADLEQQEAAALVANTAADGETQIEEARNEMPSIFEPTLHGVCRLPKGYVLLPVLKSAKFKDDPEKESQPLLQSIASALTRTFKPAPTQTTISCSYNIVKIFVSIAQLIFACITLYESRGDQIEDFGYAAFGLTVAPYAWMSFLNLIGSMICPQYSTRFLVDSQSLDELRALLKKQNREAEFPIHGTVGRLDEASETAMQSADLENIDSARIGYNLFFSLFMGIIPIAIVGALSHFSAGNSALYQRVWTMMWLVFGFVFGCVTLVWQTHTITDNTKEHLMAYDRSGAVVGALSLFFVDFLMMAPAVGGFIVVGQMLLQYGVCLRIS